MKRIFEKGDFRRYRLMDIERAKGTVRKVSHSGSRVPTVFILHEDEDTEELKDVMGFIQNKYMANVYIKNRGENGVEENSGGSIEEIVERIGECDKFILLATEVAIESDICKRELGLADAQKQKTNIALLPIKPKKKLDHEYRGSRFLTQYPYITYYNSGEEYVDGKKVVPGYYVCVNNGDDTQTIIPFEYWLKKVN